MKPMLPFQFPARCGLLAIIIGVLMPVGSPLASESAPIDKTMLDFMAKHHDCLEFNDHCSICAMIEGKPNCSTPAIACIKKAYVCTRPAGIK